MYVNLVAVQLLLEFTSFYLFCPSSDYKDTHDLCTGGEPGLKFGYILESFWKQSYR